MTTRTFTDEQVRTIASLLRTDNGVNLDAHAVTAADVIEHLYREVSALRAKEAKVRAYAEANRINGGSVGEDIHNELVTLLDEVAW